MGQRSEALFNRLKTVKDIKGLINQSEDADFDCKAWIPHSRELRSWKESIAKAACGFANATGGVIVIGLLAKRNAHGVDVIQDDVPVPDVNEVKSEALDAILKYVEPDIEVVTREIRLSKSKQGYVLLHIHESEGSPRRSRATSEFYVRMASGTVPMMYFQIEDKFGRRPRARLVLEIVQDHMQFSAFGMNTVERHLAVSITNEGRGLARFPAIRFRRTNGVVLPGPAMVSPPLWSLSDTGQPEWFSIRGGANDVVYPGETLRVATLVQTTNRVNRQSDPSLMAHTLPVAYLDEIEIKTETMCDGTANHAQSFLIPATEFP